MGAEKMPRTTKPLTNTQIERAQVKNKSYELSDGDGLIFKVCSSSNLI